MKRLHFSAVRNDAIRPLPTGGIEIDATLCRAGIFTYETALGQQTREFRPAVVLASPSVVASLKGATVTVQHPREKRVTTENYRQTTVGVVADASFIDGKIVGAIHVHDQATIDAILNGELVELSPGYDVALDPTPGQDVEHGAYDALTTDLQFHHVSLLPAGAGRQGAEVGLRLDAAGDCIVPYTRADALGDSRMDPEQLKAMIAEMMPDVEALQSQVAEQAMASLQEMLPAMIAEAVSGAKAEGAADEGDEEKSDKDDEEKMDAEEMPLEERLDSADIDALCEFVRVTGKRPDVTLSRRALLQAAAKEAGLRVRADASTERLLGALEGASLSPKRWTQGDQTKNDAVDDFVPATELNRRAVAALGGGK